MMKKIIKSGGHCSDGCQWNHCGFWRIEPDGYTDKLFKNKDGEFVPQPMYRHYCDMFGGIEMPHGSLYICNKIYGTTYEGPP